MSEQQPGEGYEHFEVLSYDGQATVLPELGAASGPSRRRRFATIGAVAAVVVATGIGAVAVGTALGGGGAQPEAVVPADAVFYAELDLDPAAGQKVDAYRFLRKFPALKDAFTADGGYGPAFSKLFDDSGIDYARDVRPWLGKRFAVALVPGMHSSDAPRFMAVVQATDEGKARASVDRLVDRSGMNGLSVTVADGYAVFAAPIGFTAGAADGGGDAAAELVAEAHSGSLADSESYRTALASYGDTVAAVWADGDGMSKALGSLYSGLGVAGAAQPAQSLAGQSVAVLRFDGDTLEVLGHATGSGYALSPGGVPAVTTLPDSTLVAVGVNDLGALLADAYGPVWDQLGNLAVADGLGDVPSPKSWPTLFGDQTVLALGGGSAEPDVGVRLVGGPKTTSAVLDLLERATGPVFTRTADDGLVVASSRTWLNQLVAGGAFGSSAAFHEAVPDAAAAGAVAFVDVNGLVDRFGSELPPEARQNLDPLRAVGFSATSVEDTSSFRLRLLTD